MYLLDTNIISEKRKGTRANSGVLAFWRKIVANEDFLCAQVTGELRRGVELLKYRGDLPQATLAENWLERILEEYGDRILPFNAEAADIWGKLLCPHNQNAVDKQIAAIALLYDLTLVTRNEEHFAGTGVRVLNPWTNDTPNEASSVEEA